LRYDHLEILLDPHHVHSLSGFVAVVADTVGTAAVADTASHDTAYFAAAVADTVPEPDTVYVAAVADTVDAAGNWWESPGTADDAGDTDAAFVAGK